MTRVARTIVVLSLSPILAMSTLVESVDAQEPLLEIENGQATEVLQVAEDGGFVVKGSLGTGTTPATGGGVRLMWYPGKAALRAGVVGSDEWDNDNVGGASIALGTNTTANGGNAVALGAGTTASGGNSTAAGTQTVASGSASTALGSVSRAYGAAATAMGSGTEAGDYSTATGRSTRAVGFGSTAMGNFTTASAEFSTALGDRSTASGPGSTASGNLTLASGEYSLAIGIGTKATGARSVALGDNTTAAGLGSVAMGSYVTAGNGSFIFGDRSSTQVQAAGSNQFVVRAHGGIGFNSGTNIGCDLPAGVGAWACTSSRMAKEGFEAMDGEAMLARLALIPIQRWTYLGSPSAHVGPVAEDFWAAFGLGEGSTTITTVDADGIALLGVQTLERRTAELRAENAELRAANAELAEAQADLLRRLEALEARGDL